MLADRMPSKVNASTTCLDPLPSSRDQHIVERRPETDELPAIFVINLDRASERRAAVDRHLRAVGVPYVRVSALDGETIEPEAAAAFVEAKIGAPRRRPLGPAEVACYASHLMVLRYVIAEQLAGALIVEDDIEVIGDLRTILLSLHKLDRSCVVAKLEGREINRRNRGVVVDHIAGADLVSPLHAAVGAAAYYVTLDGARAILDLCRTMTAPFEEEVADRNRLQAHLLELRPFPVRRQKGSVSYVRQDRIYANYRRRGNERSPLAKLASKLGLPLRRLRRRLRLRRLAMATARSIAGQLGARPRWRRL